MWSLPLMMIHVGLWDCQCKHCWRRHCCWASCVFNCFLESGEKHSTLVLKRVKIIIGGSNCVFIWRKPSKGDFSRVILVVKLHVFAVCPATFQLMNLAKWNNKRGSSALSLVASYSVKPGEQEEGEAAHMQSFHQWLTQLALHRSTSHKNQGPVMTFTLSSRDVMHSHYLQLLSHSRNHQQTHLFHHPPSPAPVGIEWALCGASCGPLTVRLNAEQSVNLPRWVSVAKLNM